MLPWVCSATDLRRRQNVARTSVDKRLVCHVFFLTHFDVICDLLLHRRTTTWNLFVKESNYVNYWFASIGYFNLIKLFLSTPPVRSYVHH